jgi:hypothetical protein
MKVTSREGTQGAISRNSTPQWFLSLLLALIFTVAVPISGFCQTRGMEQRQDRRADRGERMQQRGDMMVERSDDPIGIRGPQRREDRGTLRQDRREDRRERIY